MLKKVLLWVGIIVVVVLAVGMLFSGDDQPTKPTKKKPLNEAVYTVAEEKNWLQIFKQDRPQIVSGDWKEPVYLEVNQLGWIESGHITSDGELLYYMFYPGKDLFGTVLVGGPFQGSADIYVSKREPDGQFRTHKPVDQYGMVEVYGAAGIMPDEEGNYFYNSEREARSGGMTPGEYRENIYRNDKLLGFNTEELREGNPHYCKAKDELWFDCSADESICVLKDAARDNFEGKPEPAPAPINAVNEDAHDMQPWLDATCETLYFASNRERVGEDFDGPWIFTSKRLGEDKWSEPELVMKSKVAVGEPTLTKDGKKLYFSQYLIDLNNVNLKTGIGELKAITAYTERD